MRSKLFCFRRNGAALQCVAILAAILLLLNGLLLPNLSFIWKSPAVNLTQAKSAPNHGDETLLEDGTETLDEITTWNEMRNASSDSVIGGPKFGSKKILLISVNPRSGSSYLADMLSAQSNTSALFFEPLRYLYETVPVNKDKMELLRLKAPPGILHPRKQMRAKALAKVRKKWKLNISSKEKMGMISNLFNCQFGSYTNILSSQTAKKFVIRKPPSIRTLNFTAFSSDVMTANNLCENSNPR